MTMLKQLQEFRARKRAEAEERARRRIEKEHARFEKLARAHFQVPAGRDPTWSQLGRTLAAEAARLRALADAWHKPAASAEGGA